MTKPIVKLDAVAFEDDSLFWSYPDGKTLTVVDARPDDLWLLLARYGDMVSARNLRTGQVQQLFDYEVAA